MSSNPKQESEDEIDISGAGAAATRGGVAAGEQGVAVGGNVLGNIIRAINIINVSGGLEEIPSNSIKEVLSYIKEAENSLSLNQEELQTKLQRLVDNYLTDAPLPLLENYLQLVGETFGELTNKVNQEVYDEPMPFGELLEFLISKLTLDKLIYPTAFDAYSVEYKGKSCNLGGQMFGVPLRYKLLELKETTVAMNKLPHLHSNSRAVLYKRVDQKSDTSLFLGQVYEKGGSNFLCPLRFRKRAIANSHVEERIGHLEFQGIATAVIADYIYYVHTLRLENKTVQQFINLINSAPGDS